MAAKKIDRNTIRNDNPIIWINQITKLLKSEKYVLLRDGWTIFEPEHFIKLGFPDRLIRELVKDHDLDGVETARGVYYLDFLYRLKTLFNVEAVGKIGRGSQAGEIIKAIHAKLGIEPDD